MNLSYKNKRIKTIRFILRQWRCLFALYHYELKNITATHNVNIRKDYSIDSSEITNGMQRLHSMGLITRTPIHIPGVRDGAVKTNQLTPLGKEIAYHIYCIVKLICKKLEEDKKNKA